MPHLTPASPGPRGRGAWTPGWKGPLDLLASYSVALQILLPCSP